MGEWKGRILTHLADRLEEQAKQRTEDMRNVQETSGIPSSKEAQVQYILYTYQTAPNGAIACHAYGPTDQTNAQAVGRTMQNIAATEEQPDLNFMVLPLEQLPS